MESYTVKNMNDLQTVPLEFLKTFHLNMTSNDIENGETNIGNKEVLTLMIKRELGIASNNPLTPDGEKILAEVEKINALTSMDKYEAAIHNLRNLGMNDEPTNEPKVEEVTAESTTESATPKTTLTYVTSTENDGDTNESTEKNKDVKTENKTNNTNENKTTLSEESNKDSSTNKKNDNEVKVDAGKDSKVTTTGDNVTITTNDSTSQTAEASTSSFKVIVIVVVILCVCIGIYFGYVYFTSDGKNDNVEVDAA